MKEPLTEVDTRHAESMAYQMGYAVAWLPIETTMLWQIAEKNAKLPPQVRRLCTTIDDCAGHLERLLASPKARAIRRYRAELHANVAQVWAGLSSSWQGPDHQAAIELRDAAEPEYFNPASMFVGIPAFEVEIWQRLMSAARRFWTQMPAGFGRWAELGSIVAAVFDDPEPSQMVSPIPRLRNSLSRLRAHPVCRGLSVSFTQAEFRKSRQMPYKPSKELWFQLQASALHEALLERFDELAKVQLAPSVVSDNTAAKRLKLTKEMQAIAVFHCNPDLTDKEIARLVGCNRTSLYRWQNFQRFKMLHKSMSSLRKGHRIQDEEGKTTLEAVDDRDPSEEA
jgi:hypothetical protein